MLSLVVRQALTSSQILRCVLTSDYSWMSQKVRRKSQDSCGDQGNHNLLRLNYHGECEKAVNKQINDEFGAFYGYLAIAGYFQEPGVGLPGFSALFHSCSAEEVEHALKLMKFQTKRGGKVCLSEIKALPDQDWTPQSALRKAMEMERDVTKSLHDLHRLAAEKDDTHLCDYIASEFLTEQHEALAELQLLSSRLAHAGPGLGLFILDEEFLKEFKSGKLHANEKNKK